MNNNSDDPTNIFDTGGLDPFGPFSRQEDKVSEVNGTKIAIREIHVEQVSPDGTRQIFISQQFLCQGCRSVYITLGVTGSINNNNSVLCQTCLRRGFFLRLFKPFWSPFVKIDGQ